MISRRAILNHSAFFSGGLISAGTAEHALGLDPSSAEDAFRAYQVVPDPSEALNPVLRDLQV